MTDQEAANKHAESIGDDCLCPRTQPGTKWGEHIYIFCGCQISESFLAGIAFERAKAKKLVEALERIEVRSNNYYKVNASVNAIAKDALKSYEENK